jgi:two-component system OmpR family response regulator
VSSLILVVDDEAPVREMIGDALSLAGYRTLSASDGLEAINLLRSNSVDLIVSDINMPKLDGFQLLESLRRHRHQHSKDLHSKSFLLY